MSMQDSLVEGYVGDCPPWAPVVTGRDLPLSIGLAPDRRHIPAAAGALSWRFQAGR